MPAKIVPLTVDLVNKHCFLHRIEMTEAQRAAREESKEISDASTETTSEYSKDL